MSQDRKWYENHLRVNILGSGAVQQCCVEAEEGRSAWTLLKPRDQGEREVHLREILLRYWDKQQAWLKKVEPYTFRTTNIRGSYFLLQFDSQEMASVWREDGKKEGMCLWAQGGPQEIEYAGWIRMPLMTWTNLDALMAYIRRVW